MAPEVDRPVAGAWPYARGRADPARPTRSEDDEKHSKHPDTEHRESNALAPHTLPALLRPVSAEKIEQMLREIWHPAWAPFLRIPVACDLPAVDVYEEARESC